MKSLLNKVIILSAMAMLVGVTDAQAGNKKKKAAVQQGRVAKMVGGIRKGVSSAHEAVSSRVSGVYASGKGLVGRAGSAVANFAAAGWDKTKSVTSSVATKAKNATVATLKFAKKPAQLALGLVVAKRVIQHNEDASATSVATTAKRKLGYSKRWLQWNGANAYDAAGGYLSQAWANRPSNTKLGIGVIVAATAVAAYKYVTAKPAKVAKKKSRRTA